MLRSEDIRHSELKSSKTEQMYAVLASIFGRDDPDFPIRHIVRPSAIYCPPLGKGWLSSTLLIYICATW